jgi:rhodanese-related sulfurtransferase
MTAEQLYSLMSKGEPVIALDVRTAAAISFQPDQIPGSRWLPLAEVVEQAAGLPRNVTIATY